MTTPRRAVERLAASVFTVSSTSPSDWREQMLQGLLTLQLAPAAGFYRVAVDDNGPQICSVRVIGDPVMAASAESLKSWSLALVAMRDDSRPHRRSTLAFQSLDSLPDRDEVERSDFVQQFLIPRGIFDSCRLLTYDGTSFAGYVGLFRPRGERFADADRRLLQPLVRPLQSAVRAALRRDVAGLPGSPADLVVTPTGRVELTSAHGRTWLAIPGFPEGLAELVRRVDRGEPLPPTFHRAGLELQRLDGEEGRVRYLVHVRPLLPLRMTPDSALTLRERSVALRLLSADPEAVIAEELGMSRETLRTHRRRIYDKLGVQNRASFLRAWARMEPQRSGANDKKEP